jgi:hypothetical protein
MSLTIKLHGVTSQTQTRLTRNSAVNTYHSQCAPSCPSTTTLPRVPLRANTNRVKITENVCQYEGCILRCNGAASLEMARV